MRIRTVSVGFVVAVTALAAIRLHHGPRAQAARPTNSAVRAQATDVVAQVVGQIDDQLRSAWKEHQIEPAPDVDDGRFLRRVTLDLTGRLPTSERLQQFLADSSPTKRSAVIDELLSSAAYAEHWSDYWYATLLGRLTREAYVNNDAFKKWLYDEFAANAPWSEIVHELVAGEGWNVDVRPGRATQDPPDMKTRYNPATNWFLKYQKAIPELAGATAKTFLGVQIQCAQCHDHKTEKWTQKDFRQFAAFYVKTWPEYYDKMLVIGTHRMDTKDRWITAPVEGKYAEYFTSYKDYVHDTPKLLDGREVRSLKSRRRELADWMVARDNPWFAQALVNRLWAKLLGVGFVEPIDDFRPSNPATLPATLGTLADYFKAQNYDIRALLRVICNSTAYQRACRDTATSSASHRYWSSYPLKQFEVEVLFDTVLQATNGAHLLESQGKQGLPLVRKSFARRFVTQLGTDDMTEIADAEETIPKALLFLNGALINGTTRNLAGLALADAVKRGASDAECIEALYLRTLSRQPTATEQAAWAKFLAAPRQVAKTSGPPPSVKLGAAALSADKMIMNSEPTADFKELVDRANSAADFAALRTRMKNNADAGLFVKAFEAWAAEAPFQHLASQSGATTAREQALEDVFWAILNSSEFLTIH